MALVEIVSTPPGQAPEWVRKAWVGLSLPVAPDHERGIQMGACGGEAQNVGGYSIPTEEALEILSAKNEDAAQWWFDNLLVMPPWLVFHRDVCKFTEG
ncbi:MAG TPA: hypothetical protein VLH19_00550 [Patescibacteria group bacterium]|nr:hypothetical protein [Patescibacteria group bacterium]